MIVWRSQSDKFVIQGDAKEEVRNGWLSKNSHQGGQTWKWKDQFAV